MHLKVVPVTRTKKRFIKVADRLFLNVETGVYFVRKPFRRYRIPDLWETTHEKKLSRAKVVAERMIAEHMAKYLSNDAGPLLARKNGKTVRAVIDEYLAVKTPPNRIGTQKNHWVYFKELKAEWGAYDITRITLPIWIAWMNRFKARKKRKTFADYVKHMNMLLGYAYEQKYTSHSLSLPNPDGPRGEIGRVYTSEEIQALWENMGETTRDQFVLCYECFMRLREALFLTWDRIDLKTGVLTLRPQDVKTGSKTGRGRSFKVSETALARLKARFERQNKRKPSPFVFPSRTDRMKPQNQNKSAWQTAKEDAGITGRARWHDLRHTALNHALLVSKAEPILVSEYAGVSLRTIQRVYLHATHEKTAKVSEAVSIFKK